MAGRFAGRLLGTTPGAGTLPVLRTATDPAAASGSFWGPAHLHGMTGPPVGASIPSRANDMTTAERLWDESEKLTGVRFVFAGDQAV